MRTFLVVFVNVVLVKSLVGLDYDKGGYEYSDEDSLSTSNEVTSNAVTEKSAEAENATECSGKKASIIVDTEANINGSRARSRHSEIDTEKATTTLINYPFSVSIQRKGSHYANGALIDKRWILTSAAEFYNVRESVKLFRARLGSVDCKREGTLVPIKRVEVHPSYNYGQPNYDLALLRLARPVSYTDFIRPISLSTIKTKVVSAKFMTTYWPRLIVKGQILPANASERVKPYSMRVSTQKLIPRKHCLSKLKLALEDCTLCLNPFVTHHTVCVPDPGAPVVAEDGLWGITSGWTSSNCNVTQSPTLFTRVAVTDVRNWLDSQMHNY